MEPEQDPAAGGPGDGGIEVPSLLDEFGATPVSEVPPSRDDNSIVAGTDADDSAAQAVRAAAGDDGSVAGDQDSMALRGAGRDVDAPGQEAEGSTLVAPSATPAPVVLPDTSPGEGEFAAAASDAHPSAAPHHDGVAPDAAAPADVASSGVEGAPMGGDSAPLESSGSGADAAAFIGSSSEGAAGSGALSTSSSRASSIELQLPNDERLDERLEDDAHAADVEASAIAALDQQSEEATAAARRSPMSFGEEAPVHKRRLRRRRRSSAAMRARRLARPTISSAARARERRRRSSVEREAAERAQAKRRKQRKSRDRLMHQVTPGRRGTPRRHSTAARGVPGSAASAARSTAKRRRAHEQREADARSSSGGGAASAGHAKLPTARSSSTVHNGPPGLKSPPRQKRTAVDHSVISPSPRSSGAAVAARPASGTRNSGSGKRRVARRAAAPPVAHRTKPASAVSLDNKKQAGASPVPPASPPPVPGHRSKAGTKSSRTVMSPQSRAAAVARARRARDFREQLERAVSKRKSLLAKPPLAAFRAASKQQPPSESKDSSEGAAVALVAAGRNRQERLLVACLLGDIAEVIKAVEDGADPSAVDERDETNGETPLWLASNHGHLSVVQWLVNERRVDVNVSRSDSRTPFFAAAYNGHLAVAAWLAAETSCDVTTTDDAGMSPATAAARSNSAQMQEWAAAPLVLPCCTGDVTRIREALDLGGEPDSVDIAGYTPLWYAARRGHDAAVRLLCMTESEDGGAKRLRVKLHRPAAPGRRTALWAAAVGGHTPVVKWLLWAAGDEASKLAGRRDVCGATPLLIACRNGHLTVAKALVAARASASVADDAGCTPLVAACERGHQDVAQWLVGEVGVSAAGGEEAARSQGHAELADWLRGSETDGEETQDAVEAGGAVGAERDGGAGTADHVPAGASGDSTPPPAASGNGGAAATSAPPPEDTTTSVDEEALPAPESAKVDVDAQEATVDPTLPMSAMEAWLRDVGGLRGTDTAQRRAVATILDEQGGVAHPADLALLAPDDVRYLVRAAMESATLSPVLARRLARALQIAAEVAGNGGGLLPRRRSGAV